MPEGQKVLQIRGQLPTKTPQTRLSHGALSSRRHRRVAIFQTLWLREWLPTRTATVEILSTAIHVLEHPSEGILTAHLRPFVPAISNEKPLSLR